MRHRRPTQHIRRYRSGRWTCINKGIRYRINIPFFVDKSTDDSAFTPEELSKIIGTAVPAYGNIAENTLRDSIFEDFEIADSDIKSTTKENRMIVIAEGSITLKKGGKKFKLIFKSDKEKGGIKGYLDKILVQGQKGGFTIPVSISDIT